MNLWVLVLRPEELSQVFLLYHSLSFLLLSHKHALISKKIFCLADTILAKMKNAAARTASAFPSDIASYKCCKLPAPPEAITGILSLFEISHNISLSKPSFVPSLSILVSKISPAPLA